MLIYHDIACQNGHILYSSARFNKQLELKKKTPGDNQCNWQLAGNVEE